jgi:hypothetical protein
MPDTPGHAATGRDGRYSLSIDDAVALYAHAGHPRTVRTVQRYCASGHLDCVKEATMLGDKYFVEPSSVARHISQIEELIALDNRTPFRDVSRPAATVVAGPDRNDMPDSSNDMSRTVATGHDTRAPGDAERHMPTEPLAMSRPVATPDSDQSRYVAGLEREVERLLEDREFTRDQIKTKDKQIEALLERDRETNILVRGLQQMLSPLLGAPRRDRDQDHDQHDQPRF